jgi:hypothetical protein
MILADGLVRAVAESLSIFGWDRDAEKRGRIHST